MNLRQLEVFHAVMITGTTVAAGRRLGISQPAVSNMVRNIESSIGLKLFERRFGRLEPTQDAHDLLAEVLPLFQVYRAIDRKVRDIRDGRVGSLRIVATSSPATAIVPSAIRSFRIRYPNIQMSFETLRVDEVLDHVSHNMADVGLTLNVDDTAAVTLKPLASRPLQVAMPRGHELSKHTDVAIADLARFALITMETGTKLGNLILTASAESGHKVSSIIETGFFANICSLVNAGVGCAIVDGFTVNGGTWPEIETRPLRPALMSVLVAVMPRNRPVSRLVSAFLSDVERVAGASRE